MYYLDRLYEHLGSNLFENFLSELCLFKWIRLSLNLMSNFKSIRLKVLDYVFGELKPILCGQFLNADSSLWNLQVLVSSLFHY